MLVKSYRGGSDGTASIGCKRTGEVPLYAQGHGLYLRQSGSDTGRVRPQDREGPTVREGRC